VLALAKSLMQGNARSNAMQVTVLRILIDSFIEPSDSRLTASRRRR
jgi:hypothetical protein